MNRFISLNSFISKQKSGDWGRDSYDEKYNFKVHCIRGADINAINEGKYDSLPIRYIESKNKAKLLEEGNIIIEISGGSPSQSTGRVCYVRGVYKNIICSNFCRAYEIKSDYSAKYFYYLIKNIYNSNVFFNFESKTTGIKNLLIESAFDNIKVPEFDLPTQQKIAAVLSALDDKIELNNKINAELEAMAKTLYDYWFVQFEFPNADGKPYKSSGGKMVYNETLKREIPEGWEVKRFGDLFEISRGNIITKETSTVGEYKVVAAGLNFSYYHNEYNREKFTITVSGSGANAGFINFWTERIYASDCTTVRGSNNYKTFIALQFLRLYQDYIFSLAKGSAQPHVYPSDIEGLNFICIPDELINEYGRISSNIYEKIANNQKQNQELATLRDWLLPMLMNGQVKVEEGIMYA